MTFWLHVFCSVIAGFHAGAIASKCGIGWGIVSWLSLIAVIVAANVRGMML